MKLIIVILLLITTSFLYVPLWLLPRTKLNISSSSSGAKIGALFSMMSASRGTVTFLIQTLLLLTGFWKMGDGRNLTRLKGSSPMELPRSRKSRKISSKSI